MQNFLLFSWIFQFWHSFHITTSFLKTIFRRTYRKPLTWTVKRLCHMSEIASNTKLFHLVWTELHNLWKFWHSKTGNSWCKLFSYWLKINFASIICTVEIVGRGRENGSGVYDVGSTLKHKGHSTKQINFPLHFRSCITLWHLQGYLSAGSTRSFFHQKKPVYSLPIKIIL